MKNESKKQAENTDNSTEKLLLSDVSNSSFVEQDIEKLCDDCCDDYTVDINNEYVGKVFQWLINNDYTICKKVGN
jgi:hypothetical protein